MKDIIADVLARLGNVLEWGTNAITDYAFLLLWIVSALLVVTGVFFLIRRVLFRDDLLFQC
jgi:hypothetical protein